MSSTLMLFERQMVELKEKINEFKEFTKKNSFDFSSELNHLEGKAQQLEQRLYEKLTVWEKLQIARNPSRPTTLEYIEMIFTDFIEFHGDRLYGDDPAIVGGVAGLNGYAVTVIGHERGKNTKDKIARNFGLPNPEGYRKALRLMQQANKFRRPIITFIDTQGAFPGKEAEERGQSEAIARNLCEMADFRVPVICVITGEGGSGGALGIGVGNRLIMLEHAYYSVISPEGAATILWKDSHKAQEAAEALKITAQDLSRFGIIDRIVAEPFGGAHRDPCLMGQNVKQVLWEEMEILLKYSEDELVEDRFRKYSNIGQYISV